jgi:hypothetical protein
LTRWLRRPTHHAHGAGAAGPVGEPLDLVEDLVAARLPLRSPLTPNISASTSDIIGAAIWRKLRYFSIAAIFALSSALVVR